MKYRACPHCGCLYNRLGNVRCVECGRSLMWSWLRVYRPPSPPAAGEPEAPPEAEAALPPPSQPVPFGPRQGEPISPTGIRLGTRHWAWATHAGLVVAIALAAAAVTAALVLAVTGHGGR